MTPLTIGDTSAMPPVAVAREALGEDGIRITIEWASRQRLHTRLVDLTTEHLQHCALSHTEPLDEQWSVSLFQHPRAGRHVVLASLRSHDRSAFRGIDIIDRDTDLVIVHVDPDRGPQQLQNQPTLRRFRSDLAPLRGRRLLVLTEAPTDDTGRPQLGAAGAQEVIADTLGPGLTVRVRIPSEPSTTANIAWDQLAFYDQ